MNEEVEAGPLLRCAGGGWGMRSMAEASDTSSFMSISP